MHPYRAVPDRPPLLWWQWVLLAVASDEDLGQARYHRAHVGGRWFVYGHGEGPFAPRWTRADDGQCPASWHVFAEAELVGVGVLNRIDCLQQNHAALAHRAHCTCEVYP